MIVLSKVIFWDVMFFLTECFLNCFDINKCEDVLGRLNMRSWDIVVFLYQLLFPHEQWKYLGWLYDVGDFAAQIILVLYEQCSKPYRGLYYPCADYHKPFKGSLLNNRYFMERSEVFFEIVLTLSWDGCTAYLTSWDIIYAFLWRDGSPWTFTIHSYMFRQDTTYI